MGSSSAFFVICLLHSVIAATCGALMMFYMKEIYTVRSRDRDCNQATRFHTARPALDPDLRLVLGSTPIRDRLLTLHGVLKISPGIGSGRQLAISYWLPRGSFFLFTLGGIVYGHYKLEEMVKMSVSILIGRNLNVIQLCTAGATCGRDTFQPLCSVEAGDNSNTGFSTNHFQSMENISCGQWSNASLVLSPVPFLCVTNTTTATMSAANFVATPPPPPPPPLKQME
uniref:DUF7865 domain-containing protein n=1 Tax=Fagus sylvatica TaxID=28930 RepID=A0A2N9EP21_FAGSY